MCIGGYGLHDIREEGSASARARVLRSACELLLRNDAILACVDRVLDFTWSAPRSRSSTVPTMAAGDRRELAIRLTPVGFRFRLRTDRTQCSTVQTH